MEDKYTHHVVANSEDGYLVMGERNGVFFWTHDDEPAKAFTQERAKELVLQLSQVGKANQWLFNVRIAPKKSVPFRERLRLQKMRAEEKRQSFLEELE